MLLDTSKSRHDSIERLLDPEQRTIYKLPIVCYYLSI